MKGAYPAEELKAIDPEQFVVNVHALQIPELNAERCVVKIIKQKLVKQ